jgi:hypothetical protein
MRKLIGYCLCVATVWLGTVTIGLAGGGTFTRGCAGRDLQVMMMLETSGLSSQQLDEAMRTMVHARMICFDGQIMDALALYDQIAQSVTSAWVLSGSGHDSLH